MTDARARAEDLIARLQRIDGLVIDLQRAITEAVADIEHLGRAAARDGGKAGVDQLRAAISAEGLPAFVRQRMCGVGLEALLQRTTSAASETWVEDIAERLCASRGEGGSRIAVLRGVRAGPGSHNGDSVNG
jgi:hypothetical protein